MRLDKKIKVILKERAKAPPLSFSKPSHKPTKKALAAIIKHIDWPGQTADLPNSYVFFILLSVT